jgi:hypothetical protein
VPPIDANEFQVHNLTDDVLSEDEKDALAYRINFVPKPKSDRKKVDAAYEEFACLVRIKYHFGRSSCGSSQETEEESSPSPFYLRSGWSVPPRLQDRHLERALIVLRDDLHKVEGRSYTRNWNSDKNDALTNFLSKPDRLIITADTNLGYAYVTTHWYREKAHEHLHDKTTYLNVSRLG